MSSWSPPCPWCRRWCDEEADKMTAQRRQRLSMLHLINCHCDCRCVPNVILGIGHVPRQLFIQKLRLTCPWRK